MGEGSDGVSATRECLKQDGVGQKKVDWFSVGAFVFLSKSFLDPEAFFMALFYLHSLTHHRIISYFLFICF